MKRIFGKCRGQLLSVVTIIVIASLALLSCGGDDPEAESETTGGGSTVSTATTVQPVDCTADALDVKMINSQFDPQTLPAPVNSVVRWTNYDAFTSHRVTSGPVAGGGFFESKLLGTGSSVCFKFTAAGTYDYHCSDHMAGTVVIQ